MMSGDDLCRLALGGQPGVDDDEPGLDGGGVVEPVPEPDYRTRDQCRAEALAEVESGRRFGDAQQTKQAGGGPEDEAVMRAEPTETKAGVELPKTEPVRAEARDDIREHHRD